LCHKFQIDFLIFIPSHQHWSVVTPNVALSQNRTFITDNRHVIDGMRMSTIVGGSFQLLDGGVGHDFATFTLRADGTIAISMNITFTLQMFRDFQPATTTQNPNEPEIWGIINSDSREIHK
jgi:hypothetical protein